MLEDKKIPVYIGSDHAGYESKFALRPFLEEAGYEVTDLGCFSEGICDYPDMAREVAEKVLETPGSFGILWCGSGLGMEIAANRLKGIRAIVARTEQDAELGRKHNDANIVSLGARITDLEEQKKIITKFLTTGFEGDLPEGERHKRRVEKMDEFDVK